MKTHDPKTREAPEGPTPVTPRSYYGRPVLKPPAWKRPDVPAYLFLGGLAGASSTLAAAAGLCGRAGLRKIGRLCAAFSVLSGVGALVHDLGRPRRFLHMLRTFKPTSPLSVGSWTLAVFAPSATAAAASELTGRLPRLGKGAGLVAGGLGPFMATYTAVLLADTAVPAWHEAHRELPFVFGGSSMAAAAAMGLLFANDRDRAVARRLGLLGAGIEVFSTHRMLRRLGFLAKPYTTGRAGRLRRASELLSATGALASGLANRRRGFSLLGGLLLLSGAATLRFAVFEAGFSSAEDPEATILPQRARLSKGRTGAEPA